jgi:hypothetical protein
MRRCAILLPGVLRLFLLVCDHLPLPCSAGQTSAAILSVYLKLLMAGEASHSLEGAATDELLVGPGDAPALTMYKVSESLAAS